MSKICSNMQYKLIPTNSVMDKLSTFFILVKFQKFNKKYLKT